MCQTLMVLNLKTSDKEVDERFRWIDIHGTAHAISDMTTTHVFFSLRMIWNHNVPEEWKIHPYKRYSNLSRGPEYYGQAIMSFIAELKQRNDLSPYFEKCLYEMANHIAYYNMTSRIG